MNNPKRVINLCLAHIDEKRCTQTRPFGDLFCHKHKDVCPKCRIAYKGNGVCCEFCNLMYTFGSIK